MYISWRQITRTLWYSSCGGNCPPIRISLVAAGHDASRFEAVVRMYKHGPNP